MKYLAFLILFISLHLNAQSEYPFAAKDDALLWKIKGEGVHKNCYLFGTMHLIEEDYFLFPSKLKKAIAKSEVLTMELADLPDPSKSLKYIMLKEGSFFDYFNEEQEDSILTWANENLNLSEEAFKKTFNKFKPFAVVQVATQMQFIGKTKSYELEFISLAEENNLDIKGLETIEQQMAIFDSLTPAQQSEMVMENIRDFDSNLSDMKSLMEVYDLQQVDALYEKIHEEGGVIEEEQEAFLDNRNANWVPQIEEMIKSNAVFIAVGAGHLGGPNGVIRLLEKEGYELIPIKL